MRSYTKFIGRGLLLIGLATGLLLWGGRSNTAADPQDPAVPCPSTSAGFHHCGNFTVEGKVGIGVKDNPDALLNMLEVDGTARITGSVRADAFDLVEGTGLSNWRLEVNGSNFQISGASFGSLLPLLSIHAPTGNVLMGSLASATAFGLVGSTSSWRLDTDGTLLRINGGSSPTLTTKMSIDSSNGRVIIGGMGEAETFLSIISDRDVGPSTGGSLILDNGKTGGDKQVLRFDTNEIEAHSGDPLSAATLTLQDHGGEVRIGGSENATLKVKGNCTVDEPGLGGPVDCVDLAEMFEAGEGLEPGDLVALNLSTGRVIKSPVAYSQYAIGVVTTAPGILLKGDVIQISENFLGKTFQAGSQAPIGLVGRVPVKVSMESGTIAVGDPLTSSSTSGVAMKATKAGKIIGYALESANQDGKIVVFLQAGYYIPPKVLEWLNQLGDK